MKKLMKGKEKIFWSIKNSTEILNKLKTKGFQASTISTYDFSTLYTTLPHNLIRNQLKIHLDVKKLFIIIIIIIIIMSLFNEDNIFSKYTNLTYGPLKSKNTNIT